MDDAAPRFRRRISVPALLFVLIASLCLATVAPTALAADAAATCSGITVADVGGTAPSTVRSLARFPNDHAVCEAVWVPLLDAGTVPQGLALVGDGTTLVSAHVNDLRSTARIVKMDLRTGSVLARVDVEKGGHGGGIEIDEAGGVWVASSTKLLYWPNIGAVFSSKYRRVRVSTQADDPFKASFITRGVGGTLWIGSFQTQELLRFSHTFLTSVAGTTRAITRADAISVRPIGSRPEGAAFWDGGLHVASSSASCGVLRTPSGARFGFGPGAQEIEFASDGSLWGIFQAGSARYPDAPYFPVVARSDRSALTEAPVSRCSTLGT
jgi:hypothetical protein